MHLHEGGANIMGTSPDMIDNAEDRQALRRGVESRETSLRETIQARLLDGQGTQYDATGVLREKLFLPHKKSVPF